MRMIASAAALLLGLLAAGCNGEVVGGGQRPAALLVVSGDLQTGTVGEELAQPLVVKVVDDAGRPVRDQLVNFRVVSGGGSVFAGSAITSREGIAQERWTLGPVAGDTQRVEARAVDSTTGQPIVFATFRAVGRPAAGAQVQAEAPAARSAPAGGTVEGALVARVVDAHGNGIPGVAVTWTVGGGGALTDVQGTTDAQGRARATWTLGANVAAPQTVDAAAAGIAQPARFTAQSLLRESDLTLSVVSGNGQTGFVGQALPQPVVIEVRGAGNRPLQGVGIAPSLTNGSSIAPNPGTTDAQGRVSFTWTLPTTPGEVVGIANVTGMQVGTKFLPFQAQAVAGPAVTMQLQFPGDPRYVIVGSTQSIGITLRDPFGNVINGVQVSGQVEAGGGSVDGPSTTGEPAAGLAAVLNWTIGGTEGTEQRLRISGGGLTTTLTRTARYVWVTPVQPSAGTVVTTPLLEVRAFGSHYLGSFSCDSLSPACITVTYGGRTTELGRRPAQSGWVGTLDLAGLPAGPLDLVFRIEDRAGHWDEETVSIVYQP